MSTEGSNFCALLDVPSCGRPRNLAYIELADRLTENHGACFRSSDHLLTRVGLCQFPDYDIVLIVTSSENITAIGAKLSTGKVCSTANQIVILLY